MSGDFFQAAGSAADFWQRGARPGTRSSPIGGRGGSNRAGPGAARGV